MTQQHTQGQLVGLNKRDQWKLVGASVLLSCVVSVVMVGLLLQPSLPWKIRNLQSETSSGKPALVGYISPWADGGRRWVGAILWCLIAMCAARVAQACASAWFSFSMLNEAQIGMAPVSPTPLVSGVALFARPWMWLTWLDWLLLGSRLPPLLAAAILRWRFVRAGVDPVRAKSVRRWMLWLFVAIVAAEGIEVIIGVLT